MRIWMALRAGVILASALILPAAEAAVITGTYSFTATGSPSNASGDISLTFDNAASFVNEATGISTGAFSFSYQPTLHFTFVDYLDRLIIGAAGNANAFHIGVDDFALVIDGASTLTPSFISFWRSTPGAGTGNSTTAGTVSFVSNVPPATAVPEPGTLALVSLGLIGLGIARQRFNIKAAKAGAA
ncbi:PEP-CTERM sorting domain-containing protein [Roseococcus sp. SYP-B2431]|uniref:PEP-CTERM sorting domain-containing protein n=1 Tax=Roseococcus sp. SYP-B2431 TaxID=2496640 RepID=UPI00103A3C10|nr:PEP-CTERM sorting domain-containing protein [Roseococcus sp. SYP-B2431]TCI00764.1 PEP-CTERM sorting domain-containing protein [Roseococcus sp. SYP-B2431]